MLERVVAELGVLVVVAVVDDALLEEAVAVVELEHNVPVVVAGFVAAVVGRIGFVDAVDFAGHSNFAPIVHVAELPGLPVELAIGMLAMPAVSVFGPQHVVRLLRDSSVPPLLHGAAAVQHKVYAVRPPQAVYVHLLLDAFSVRPGACCAHLLPLSVFAAR